MGRLKEIFKQLAREDREWEEKIPDDNNKHYSEKNGHAQRSVANDKRKKSKRRGNYK